MRQMLLRDARLFARDLLSALAVMLAFALLCAGAAYALLRGEEDAVRPARLALADEDDSLISRAALSMIASQSSVQTLLELIRTDADAARAGIADGRYDAALVLPAGYADAILHGEAAQADLVLSDSAALQRDLLAQLALCGQWMLAAGQNGVFAAQNVLSRYDVSSHDQQNALLRLNSALLDGAMRAPEALEVQTIPYRGTSLTLRGCYAALWTAFLLSLSGMLLTRLYSADCYGPLYRRLRSGGISDAAFLAGKLLYGTLFRMGLLLAAALLLRPVLPLTMDFAAVTAAWSAALLSTLCGAALRLTCLGRGNSAAVIGICSAAGLFLNGGLLPREQLPLMLLRIGSLTPTGTLFGLLSPLFGGRLSAVVIVSAVLYGVAALLLCRHALRHLPEETVR